MLNTGAEKRKSDDLILFNILLAYYTKVVKISEDKEETQQTKQTNQQEKTDEWPSARLKYRFLGKKDRKKI